MKTPGTLLRGADGRVWLQTLVDGNVRCSYLGSISDYELERYALERGMQVVDVPRGSSGKRLLGPATR